jgi:hypothetical protein
LTWCKQQKRKTSKEQSYSERRTMIDFFLYFSELWKQFDFHIFFIIKYVLFFYVTIFIL